ncbi:MAG TPA: cytochrome c oxidase subunit II [Acetobacteraceae bacterium]|nr:cytochrome c oxidase subunit II [Acetobacteraceae bacterium]
MSFVLPEASANAPEVDALMLALLVISGAVLALVFGLMLLYMVKYRAGSGIDRGAIAQKTWRMETAWTAATLVIFFGLFIWGADLYVRMFQPPADALKIYIVAKRWMWKVEHAGGEREIDAVHLPVGRPIELVMTSEDVIHDFSVPAFRIKHDVLPDRYETLWFTAVRAGTYHLFCTQLCGASHSSMVGEVVAMPAPDYQKWLEQNGTSETLALAGQTLFMRYGCSGCHGGNGAGGGQAGGTVRAPPLIGLYGSPVPLSDGTVVTADDLYIRDSILMPDKQVVASYAPVMPSFAGKVSEEDLVKLIAYIKSLAPRQRS